MINIIYEDDYLLVVAKPPRMLVVPAPGKPEKTLTDILNEQLRQRGLTIKVHPAHRLDYETSGLVIYAKGKKIQQQLMEQFHRQSVKKQYLALIQGHLAKPSAEINTQIEGKPAITRYRVKEVRPNFSIVEVEPVTGRTNQIRLQFKQLGHPLVGERRFAFARDYPVKFRRLALHATELRFTHPMTGVELHLTAPLPPDLATFLSAPTA